MRDAPKLFTDGRVGAGRWLRLHLLVADRHDKKKKKVGGGTDGRDEIESISGEPANQRYDSCHVTTLSNLIFP